METNRQAHQDSMQAQLDQWHARLEVLEAAAAKAAVGAKAELHKAMEELHALQASAKTHFAELAAASAETWKDVKTSIDSSWSRVSTAVEATWNRAMPHKEPIKHEHKKELHDKVIARREQLAASLAALQADPQNAKSERAGAVEAALAALQTHLGGGWESIDEQESAALTRWLESSRFLFDGEAAPEKAPVLPNTISTT
jgi:hypothetical protein